MSLDEYRLVFVVGTLVLMLLVASPALSLGLAFPNGTAKFSEFWVLGPNHTIGDYPFNVRTNETHDVFVGVGNHLGQASYYTIYVKFRNSTQPSPNSSDLTPSPLPPIYEFQVFVPNEGTWESNLTFSVLDVSSVNNATLVKNVNLNGVVFPVNSTSVWDSVQQGYYYQVFLELWLYNSTSGSFQYHNRFVGLWLNVNP